MPYSQVTDVRMALTMDGDAYDEDTPSQYSDEQLLDCVARADAQIDLYLRSNYTVPVAAPDGLLKDWSSSIAAYLACLIQSNDLEVSKTSPIQLRYDRALESLRQVAAGVLTLPYPVQEEAGPEGVTVVNTKPEGFSILCAEDELFTYSLYGVRKADGTWYSEG